MSSEVLQRIPEVSDWDGLLQDVSRGLELGALIAWDVIEVGLEDSNIKLNTEKGEYLFKGYASSRPQSEIDRYDEIFAAITKNNIPHPKLMDKGNKFVHEINSVQFSVYEWVAGKSFYQLGRVPDNTELKTIVGIAANLNKLPVQPTFLHDSWAVYNLPKAFDESKDQLNESDKSLVKKAVEIYSGVIHDSLPHAFVHGDITQQNLILADNGEIFLIDFGVANYYPRIQELALMVALLIDKTEPVIDRINKLVAEYETHIKLTDAEKQAIFPYVVASQAMEILGVYRERSKGSNLKELDYWINIGRSGLKLSFAELE